VTLRARWVPLRACWVTLRARVGASAGGGGGSTGSKRPRFHAPHGAGSGHVGDAGEPVSPQHPQHQQPQKVSKESHLKSARRRRDAEDDETSIGRPPASGGCGGHKSIGKQLPAPVESAFSGESSKCIVDWVLSERETVVELLWAADSCPCVVEAANRVTVGWVWGGATEHCSIQVN
jgi:hypothetical protein